MGSAWIIANPRAGAGRALSLAGELARLMPKHHVRLVQTQDPDAALAAGQQAVASGADVLVACGGDGTAHWTHQPLVGTQTAFALLPCGSGDDIAHSLGAWRDPHHLAEGVDHLVSRPDSARQVDVGEVSCSTGERSTYLGVLSVGFDSCVNERANTLPRLAGQRYRVAMLQELLSFRPIAFVARGDQGEYLGDAMLVAVGNGDRYGGGMLICAGAQVDDGLLDVTVLTTMSRMSLMRLFPRVYSGRHLLDPRVLSFRSSRLDIQAPGQVVFADGERVGPAPASIGIRHGALRVLVPAS